MASDYQGHNIENTILALEKAIQQKKTEIEESRPASMFAAGAHQGIHLPFDTQQMMSDGQEVLLSFLDKSKEEIQKEPWLFLGKIAMSSFGIGLILAHRRTHTKPKENI